MPIKVKKGILFLKRKKQNKNKKRIAFLLIFTTLLGILVGISMAKYQVKITGKGFVSIAKPVLEVRREQSLLLTALAPKASYVFEVRNYKEQERNEVEMEYYIEIISPEEEAIQFALYQGDKQIPLKENKTEKRILSKEKEQTDSYRLEITYNKEKGITRKDIKENVEIKIHSIQKT